MMGGMAAVMTKRGFSVVIISLFGKKYNALSFNPLAWKKRLSSYPFKPGIF
jgi:hypothetical protein